MMRRGLNAPASLCALGLDTRDQQGSRELLPHGRHTLRAIARRLPACLKGAWLSQECARFLLCKYAPSVAHDAPWLAS